MTPGARVAAAIEVLDRALAGEPVEKLLTRWARASRYAGSKDRAAVRDLVFDGLRRRQTYAAVGGADNGRGLMIGAAVLAGQAEALFTGQGHAPSPLVAGEGQGAPEGLDMPDWLVAKLSHWDDPEGLCDTLRHRAPVTLRVSRKTGVEAARAALSAEGIETQLCGDSALHVTEGARKLRHSRAYCDGMVELQDASAQAFCEAVPLSPGDRVLDYCAGGGGKALALADRVAITAHAHDIDPRRMADLPARAARAGLTVTPVTQPQGLYDVVVCDVPCSGSGTWRRSPQDKWTLTPARLDDLVAVQRQIVAKALHLLRPGGVLAYATCSILAEENEAQHAWVVAQYPDLIGLDHSARRPTVEQDGFFWAMFRKPPHDAD